MPTIQLLGSAAGAVNTASPAIPTPGAQSKFSAIMSGILGQAAPSSPATPTANSSEAGAPSVAILSSSQLQKISPALLKALNAHDPGESLAVLAEKLAALMSGMGNGKLVPLSADIDLSKLAAAGIELPEGLEDALEGGKAMLLVDEDALKALLSGGGWKEGISVPALLMVGTDTGDQPGVAYVETALSVSANGSGPADYTSLQFKLSFNPGDTINISDNISDNDKPSPAVDPNPLMDLAALIALLESSIVDGTRDSDSADDNNNENNIPLDISLVPTVGKQSDDAGLKVDNSVAAGQLDDVAQPEAGSDVTAGDNGTDSNSDTGLSLDELAAEVGDLIAALLKAEANNQPAAAEPVSDVDRVAAALKLLAGQAVDQAASGESEAAGKTLDLLDKLGRLSTLGDNEKRQVLSDLATALRSVLADTGNQSSATPSAADGETFTTPNTNTFTAPNINIEKTHDVPAGNNPTFSEKPVDAALPQDRIFKITTDSGTGTDSLTAGDQTDQSVNPPANNTYTTNNDSSVSDSPQTLLAALESAASLAGELAARLVDGRHEAKQEPRPDGVTLMDRIAGVLRQSAVEEQQPVTAKAVLASGQTPQTDGNEKNLQSRGQAAQPDGKTAGSESRVMDKPSANNSGTRPADNVQAPSAAGDKQVQDANAVKATSPAAIAAADVDGRKVTVPVSLSSLNKPHETQSKTQKASAVSAFSASSRSSAQPSGEGNDLLKAMRAAAGDKGQSDLVEATLVDKKTEAVEALGRTAGAEAEPKSGGVQVQGDIRTEQTVGRVQALRGDQLQQSRTAEIANQNEIFEKIINSARLTRVGAATELSMKLEPDHLGMMRVRMSVDDNKVMHATIQVQSHEARSMIEGSLHRLREALADQGIKVEKFSVDVRQHQQDQSQQQFAGAGRNGQWEPAGQGFARNSSGSALGTGAVSSDPEPAGGENQTKTKIYEYSTLEWVA